jgi:hypothetical protein
MKTRTMLAVGFAVGIMSCMRPTWPGPVPVENDQSIAFPRFSEYSTAEVGAGAVLYELDGAVLRAIMIAMNDYVRPDTRGQACVDSPEAHRYRVIRQENIIFVRIDENPEFCGLQYLSLDSGARYAISTDGRILRRAFYGGPEKVLDTDVMDTAAQDDGATIVQQDGGTAPATPGPPDASSPGILDGGLPNPP